MSSEGREATPGDPCPVCQPVGYVRLDPDGHLSCSNCLWNSEEDSAGQEPTWRVLSDGHLLREFDDRQEAEGYAASWNAAYPPSEGYAEFTVEATP